MSQQIIQQPNGAYGIFSSNSDTIILWDATDDEVVEWLAEQAAEDARRAARQVLGHVATGQPRKAYFQFTLTWAEALERDRAHDGDASRQSS